MSSGIYQIRNLVTGDIYVGSATRLLVRKSQHFTTLDKQKHYNIVLQRAWNKYGATNFEFEILEECDPSLLLEREQYYLDTLHPVYNISAVAEAPRRGVKVTDETKQKLSDALRGNQNAKGHEVSAELRLIVSNNYRKLSDEQVLAADVMIQSGELTYEQIARLLGVSKKIIYKISSRKLHKRLFS